MDLLETLEILWRGEERNKHLIQILLIFLAFYLFLRFLKMSKGPAFLRGVLLIFGISIALLFVAADILHLEHITWIFERVGALFFLAILILFQPELRRGLIRLGIHPFFQSVVLTTSQAVDEIVEAAGKMSLRKTGALIAIQRDAPLTSFIEKGTPLNGEITSELLQTIFQKGSALHDAAVIIRGNRVAAAGCLFPLSENPDLSKALGTRHRAALGLTEEVDAVTVVVSEETGRISLGVDGKLLQNLSVSELRKKLNELVIEAIEGGA